MKREKYICTKSFWVDKFDDDGFWVVNSYVDINEGEMWIYEDIPEKYKLFSNAIHMVHSSKNKENWIAITADRLREHFKFVEKLEE